MTPLPNQTALWHGLADLSGQQDLFPCDLGPAERDETETPDWAKALFGGRDAEDQDDE